MLNKFLSNSINKATVIYLAFYLGLFFGFIPRQAVFVSALILIYFLFKKSLSFNFLLFVRLIPFFVALPLTESFDNFNLWRVIAIMLFFKWVLESKIYLKAIKLLEAQKFSWLFLKQNLLEVSFVIFVFWSILSLLNAIYFIEGFKRIIYLLNIALLFPIVIYCFDRQPNFLRKIAKSLTISGFILVAFAIFQQLLAFLISINVFQHFWGETVSYNLYGKNWSRIVMNLGNTWYSYPSNSTPRLRVFSVFPDSHTFPMYLLMILPFYFYWQNKNLFKLKTLVGLFLFLITILLSGTRGIWVAVIFPLGFLCWRLFLEGKFRLLRLNIMFFVVFILAIGGAFIIYSIPQFLSFNEGFKSEVLSERISSVVSFEETSNKGRLYIWRKTLDSIKIHPIYGVGISNFPVILQEHISTIKAGASAHNLYLNMMAEVGIVGGFLFLIIIFEIWRRIYQLYLKTSSWSLKVLTYFLAFFLLWIYGYSLTDAALMDERTLILFTVIAGIGTILYKFEFNKGLVYK